MNRVVVARVMVIAALVVGAVACSGSDDGGNTDAGRPDPACETYGADASRSCVAPCSHGNALLVGEFCTRGGGQCDDNLEQNASAAFICTADYDMGADSFCTRPCSQDSQCGEGAACTGDPGADGGMKGCVPASCL